MNAKYCGRQICRDSSDTVIKIIAPTVLVTMKEKEVERFESMMKWISSNFEEYAYSLIGEPNVVSAYVEVENSQDGAEFLMHYRQAKQEIK